MVSNGRTASTHGLVIEREGNEVQLRAVGSTLWTTAKWGQNWAEWQTGADAAVAVAAWDDPEEWNWDGWVDGVVDVDIKGDDVNVVVHGDVSWSPKQWAAAWVAAWCRIRAWAMAGWRAEPKQ